MSTCPACGVRPTPGARFCSNCGTSLSTAQPASEPQEFKIVTVMFCDVVDSVRLGSTTGPSVVQRVLDRFSETTREVLAGHSAKVGSRRGDGIMAVFGVPVLHDDDALRAVRGAVELRQRLRELGDEVERTYDASFSVRIGVDTGRVLVGKAQALEEEVTGQSADLAKRFQEAADPGEILIGEATHELVRDAVSVQPVGGIEVRGVDRPVEAFRLVDLVPDHLERRPEGPMIGRGPDLKLLVDLFERVTAHSSCHLVTVLGPAGVGKSRLVGEVVSQFGDRATVLRGQCLSYGDSVAFWPMVQIIRQAAGIAPTDPLDVSRRRLDELLAGEEAGGDIAEWAAQLIGLSQDVGAPGGTFSAFRGLLEALARHRPVVMLVDDLHCADPIMLDAIEHVASSSPDSPILIVGMARHDELLRVRPQWPGGRLNATSMLLPPLSEEEGEQLVSHLLGSRPLEQRAQAHITHQAEGYPLIIQELVRKYVKDEVLRPEAGRWVTTRDLAKEQPPPSIEALLSARLERLAPDELTILRRAAVVGEHFHAADVEALTADEHVPRVAGILDDLLRQELIRLDQNAAIPLPTQSGQGYRFWHNLIRTVAYERMTEQVRADLHERYADWLEKQAGKRLSQFEELIGYHLYESLTWRRKLGPDGDHGRTLARRAGECFAATGKRASLRGDVQLTCAQLDRAVNLLPVTHTERLEVLRLLAEALKLAGELDRAAKTYSQLVEAAREHEDPARATQGILGRAHVQAVQDLASFLRDGREEVDRAIDFCERVGDAGGLSVAWYLRAYADWSTGGLREALSAADTARKYAAAADDKYWEAQIVRLQCITVYWGPTPMHEVVRRSEEALRFAEATSTEGVKAGALSVLARTDAARGDFDGARRRLREANKIRLDLGDLFTPAADSITEGMVELLAGNLGAAEKVLRRGEQELQRMGDVPARASVIALLARVTLRQGRAEEAERMTTLCERIAASYQFDAQVKWRSIRAVVLARRHDFSTAEHLAREAVRRAELADQIETEAEARVDLGEVLRLASRKDEAAQELERAASLFSDKGHEVAATATRDTLVAMAR